MPHFEMVGEVIFGEPKVVRDRMGFSLINNNTVTVKRQGGVAVRIPIIFKDKKIHISAWDMDFKTAKFSFFSVSDPEPLVFPRTLDFDLVTGCILDEDILQHSKERTERLLKFIIDKRKEDYSNLDDRIQNLQKKIRRDDVNKITKREVNKIVDRNLDLVAKLSVEQFRFLYPIALQLNSVNLGDLMSLNDGELKTVLDQALIRLIHEE